MKKQIITGYQPERVFRYFEELSAIPRGSGNESGVADYLQSFAAARGLSCYRDKLNNIFIKMPASTGLETKPALLFQGHMDMVCEKNADVKHDFMKDGIELVLHENGILSANGTTLGGDDGIAVATMLALLDGEIPVHPAFECLFTVSEEVGLDGAKGFDYSRVSARTMINMDSENEDIVTAGCAGGCRSDITVPLTLIAAEGEALRVSLTGLCGGHSGENIKDGRANANKTMGRLLLTLAEAQPMHLLTLHGGSKDNAIPRECFAEIAVKDANTAKTVLSSVAASIAAELGEGDRNFRVVTESITLPARMADEESTMHILGVIGCAANGVLEMSRNIKGLVEFSRNLGVITAQEDAIDFVFSSRSAIESQLEASLRELSALAALCGGTARHYARYPGWNYAKVSPLRDRWLAAYEEIFEKRPTVNVIHAGLECGLICAAVPDMDMISVGPNMKDIHSPDEKLDLRSCERFFRVLSRVVASFC